MTWWVLPYHVCQMAGKARPNIPTALLQPIPIAEEPFSRVIFNCVGPLPKTMEGNQYIFSILCATSRFSKAIPLRNTSAKKIVRALTNFFMKFGLPKEIQSDQGSNFTLKIFQQAFEQLVTETICIVPIIWNPKGHLKDSMQLWKVWCSILHGKSEEVGQGTTICYVCSKRIHPRVLQI